jgi:UDP-N-acetylglucosamine--N-acetylmuramyl-(pentapeptide) pyrophosphoryl-undecaprenol N-acetylglucosamine transferase
LKLLIAGGGTGGHLFPGIAVAEAFRRRIPGARVLFVGAGRPLEKEILGKAGFDHRSIPARGLAGMRGMGRMVSGLYLTAGMAAALGILLRFRPRLVLGVGWYASGPVIVSARLIGCPVFLQEQNVVPGMANRFLSRSAKRVYAAFEESRRYFSIPAGRIRVTGNPVRAAILEAARSSRPVSDPAAFRLLVLGGSQGARRINEAITEAASGLSKIPGLVVTQQTGPKDAPAVKAAFDAAGVKAVVQPFFDDMEKRYTAADLVVCRAGATTVAELTVLGKPAILIPYPHAGAHQMENARVLADRGAAEMIPETELTGNRLAGRIRAISENRSRLIRMGNQARGLGNPDAADTLVEDFLAISAGSE